MLFKSFTNKIQYIVCLCVLADSGEAQGFTDDNKDWLKPKLKRKLMAEDSDEEEEMEVTVATSQQKLARGTDFKNILKESPLEKVMEIIFSMFIHVTTPVLCVSRKQCFMNISLLS